MLDAKYQGVTSLQFAVLLSGAGLAVFGAVAAVASCLATGLLVPAYVDAEHRADVAEIVALEALGAADGAIDDALAVSCVYHAPVAYVRTPLGWAAHLVDDIREDSGTCVCQESWR